MLCLVSAHLLVYRPFLCSHMIEEVRGFARFFFVKCNVSIYEGCLYDIITSQSNIQKIAKAEIPACITYS
jgi:hypothetical protein